ncbi:MAG: band 7 protein [Planctomycetales bacterium]|nr:band 7 protein [Planctomycetales bacterium]
MPDNIFMEERTKQQAGSWLAAVVALLVFAMGILWFVYTQFRIDVPTGHMALLIRKTGLDVENADEVAPTPEHKGVQKETLTEGRYFYNPYAWSWRVIKQTEIPAGKLGIQVRLYGDDLPPGEFLAMKENQKGIVPGVLQPGRYPINPYLYQIEYEKFEPVTIEAGFKGVVTNLSGPLATDPNQLEVPEGFRGTLKKSLDPGTYTINPYETRINKVDCRSQRFTLSENKDFGFPSKDGFWVSMDAVIEFRVDPERVAEVYVLLNEDKNGDRVDEEIINKIILPNARSFCRLEGSNTLGREFIRSRSEFQERFQQEMIDQCKQSGIQIIQALITKTVPPDQIAEPIRQRDTLKEQEKQYQQEILAQEAVKKAAIQVETVKQKQALVGAEQEIIRITTEALREQEVSTTKGSEKLAVAQLKLDATKDEAAAVLSRGKGAAEVVQFKNKAEAAGWKRSVEAFDGDGSQFARYVLYQKLSAAYRTIMVNTADSPIMKIFDSFTPTNPPANPPTKKE